MEIRPVDDLEIKTVSLLWEEMQKELHESSQCKVNWWMVEIRGLLGSNDFDMFVFDEDGQVVGFFDILWILNAMENRFEAHIRYIYLKPEYRGNGTIKSSLEFVKKLMKKRGATHLIGYSEDNKLAMWQAHGFKPFAHIFEMEIE